MGVELPCSFTGGVLALAGDKLEPSLIGEVEGVTGRRGDGDAGDSGRRKGEARGDPNESGEGL